MRKRKLMFQHRGMTNYLINRLNSLYRPNVIYEQLEGKSIKLGHHHVRTIMLIQLMEGKL